MVTRSFSGYIKYLQAAFLYFSNGCQNLISKSPERGSLLISTRVHGFVVALNQCMFAIFNVPLVIM